MSKLCKIVLLLGCVASLTESHVRLWKPISRSSVFRDPRFSHLNPQPNWDDDGLYCGQVPQLPVVRTCGICGDPFSSPTPRQNEHGGKYGKGIIVERYASGSIIDAEMEFTTTHHGFAEYQLCTRIPETEDCFQPLELAKGGTKIQVPVDGQHGVLIRSRVKLPQGVSCSHCVLRMNYRAGNSWGNCGNGTEGMGCGLQETFRHCSDISVN